MIDELELLADHNPVPDLTGNPGPAKATVVALKSAVARSRRRWWLAGAAVAASVAVLVGAVALRSGDDDGATTAASEGSEALAPSDLEAEEAATPNASVEEPFSIPWPDPVEVVLEPGMTVDNTTIEVPAGVQVLDVRWTGEDEAAQLMVCASACFTRAELASGESGALEATLLGGSDGSVVQAMGSAGEDLAAASLVPSSAPRLSVSFPAVPLGTGLARWTTSIEVAVSGAATDEVVTLVGCDASNGIAVSSCTALGAFTGAELAGGAVLLSDPWLGGPERRDLVILAVAGDELGAASATRTSPAAVAEIEGDVIRVTVTDLAEGEVVNLTACRVAGSVPCPDVVAEVTVVGSGSHEDVVTLPNEDQAELHAEIPEWQLWQSVPIG